MRYRANKKYLKIKTTNQDDTGVFICKGINGFGSVQVRIELIILGKQEADHDDEKKVDEQCVNRPFDRKCRDFRRRNQRQNYEQQLPRLSKRMKDLPKSLNQT